MDVFYALAEPSRRKIIELLANSGRLTATEICGSFKITPQAISQHLKVLLEARVLSFDRQAQRRIYRINPDSMLEVERWTRHMESLWNERLDALDRVLEEEKRRAGNKKGNGNGRQ
ncbi:MAG: winged helix-turn-helix transcriptional regulator [Candidatus Micrarchaeota archaeon]|nr:winged helix-turn-helix transcriptional regulator [Candidatus Micrarchaeota archaeon]